MIRYIWFDLGYTLVKTNREQMYQKVLHLFGVYRSMEEIARAYHRTDKLFMREYPGVLGKDHRVFMPWYIGELNYALNLTLPIEEVMSYLKKINAQNPVRWEVCEGVIPTLRTLKKHGYHLGLISNWDHTARDVLASCRLDQELDDIVISSEVGVEKPDPAIFQLAMERSGATPSQSLYIGDNYYDDVIGSRKAGIHCLLINRFGNFGIEELTHVSVIHGVQEVLDYFGHVVEQTEVI